MSCPDDSTADQDLTLSLLHMGQWTKRGRREIRKRQRGRVRERMGKGGSLSRALFSFLQAGLVTGRQARKDREETLPSHLYLLEASSEMCSGTMILNYNSLYNCLSKLHCTRVYLGHNLIAAFYTRLAAVVGRVGYVNSLQLD